MNIETICFHVGGGLQEALLLQSKAQMFNELHNISVRFYCYNIQVYNNLLKKGYKCINESTYDDRKIKQNERDELLKWFKKHSDVDFRELYFSHLIFVGENRRNELYLQSLIYSRLKVLKEAYENGFYAEVFVDFSGDEIPHNLFRFYAHLVNGRLINYRETVFPDRLGFMENRLGIWEIPAFQQIIPSTDEQLIIRKFLATYLEPKKVFWGDPKKRDFTIKVTRKGVGNKILSLAHWYRFIPRVKRYINKIRVNRLYGNWEKVKIDQYFYFPLHYPLDSQLTYRGRPFIDQVSFACLLTHFLPEETRLIIKEHPHARGAIPFKALKQLDRNDRILLVHPWENSHNIVAGAKAVFVINSTVALEALYHGKSVISFGRSYFTGHDLMEEYARFYDLYDLYKWKPKYKPEYIKDRLNLFLAQALRYSTPVASRKVLLGELTEAELKSFVNGLIDHLEINPYI